MLGTEESENKYLHYAGGLILVLGWSTLLERFYQHQISGGTLGLLLMLYLSLLAALRSQFTVTVQKVRDTADLQRQFRFAFLIYAIAVLSVLLTAWARPVL